jgi:hypothetical protein
MLRSFSYKLDFVDMSNGINGFQERYYVTSTTLVCANNSLWLSCKVPDFGPGTLFPFGGTARQDKY